MSIRGALGARISAVLAVLVLAAGVAACGSSSSGNGGTGSKEFTFWSFWTKDEPVAKVLQSAIASFQKDTGVQVHVQWQGRDSMTKVKAALNTDNVPDLVDQGFPTIKAGLGLSGQALDLSSVYKMAIPGEPGKTVRDVVPTSYDSLDTAAGKKIVVPYYVSAQTWWVSGKAYPQVADNPPTTWAELSADFAKVKSQGQNPLAQDTDILGYDGTLVYAALERALGPGNLHKLAASHDGSGWSAPKVAQALQAISALASSKDYIPGYDSSKYPAMEKDWAHGKAAFLYMGSWVPYYDGPDAAKDFDLRTFNFPTLVGTDHSVPAETFGFAIPTKAKNGPAADKFIAYLMGRKWLTQMSTKAQILTPRPDITVPPVLRDLQNLMKSNPLYPVDDGVSADFPDLDKQFQPLARDLITGKLSAAEFAGKAKAAQAQYWKLNG